MLVAFGACRRRVTTERRRGVLASSASTTADDPESARPRTLRCARWLRDEFYGGSPQSRPKIRSSDGSSSSAPSTSGAAWEARDEDGLAVLSDSGPLDGGQGGLAVYDAGADVDQLSSSPLNVRKSGGEATIFVRYSRRWRWQWLRPVDWIPARRNNVRLTKLTGGARTASSRRRPFRMPTMSSCRSPCASSVTRRQRRLRARHRSDHRPRSHRHHVAARGGHGRAWRAAASATPTSRSTICRSFGLTRLGAVRETLLSEPFQAHAASGLDVHRRREAVGHLAKRATSGSISSKLLNVVLTVDYGFKYASVAPSDRHEHAGEPLGAGHRRAERRGCRAFARRNVHARSVYRNRPLRHPAPLSPGRPASCPRCRCRSVVDGGSGVAGLGWDLDLAAVRRRTDKGLPTYDDARDRFALQGDELVSQGGRRYRFRIEGRFARIRHLTRRRARRVGRDRARRHAHVLR